MNKFILALTLLFATSFAFGQQDRDRVSGTISADGTTTIEWRCDDKVSSIGVEGTFGGGTVTIQYEVVKDSGNYVAFAEGDAKAAAFGFKFQAPSSRIQIVVSGATTPTITYAIRVLSEG